MAEKILNTVTVAIQNDLHFETTSVTVNGHYKQEGLGLTADVSLSEDEVAALMPGFITKLKEKMAEGGHTVSDVPVYVAPEPEPEAGD
tara:strand:- start:20 stop:283 length:264 start_codon:yes stop_codon:yes gene_type:complete